MTRKRIIYLVLIALFSLSAHLSRALTIQIGEDPPVKIEEFLQEDKALFVPFKSSLKQMGLEGFMDSLSGRLYIKAHGKLIVVDPSGPRAIIEQHELVLPYAPRVEQGVVYVPVEVYTQGLARVLGKPIKVMMESRTPEANPPEEAPPEEAPAIETRPVLPDEVCRNRVDVIVIDPGHGGEDTGAEGPGGLEEKVVTLSLANKLKRRLENDPEFTVVMTRKTDVEVPLIERPLIAGQHNGDLFISIHANASYRLAAQGFETYFLSLTASDELAQDLADHENLLDYYQDRQNINYITDLELILGDMAQNEYLKDSETFAMKVQENMAKVMHSDNRGVKQAPFVVLMDLDMPGVLVEVGFLTNPEEAKNITRPEVQEKIADALYRSIKQYRDMVEFRLGNGLARGAGK